MKPPSSIGAAARGASPELGSCHVASGGCHAVAGVEAYSGLKAASADK
jgi:hypothetical protein